ncbi:RsmD family RNA methyltransferase [Olivibacter sp. XZL3]|uniref:RsmD family RNA methyltransferase n=1 Tax=Olivibacter sp. XZL3 TaxID=1735116 RepID=UPI001066C4B9|nr:RsmD family RNA methyltransferase [Olivibacter sp. XZL3]
MRIIGGHIKGVRLSPPTNLPVRPTTDLAKEALFNILENSVTWDETDALDLFSGTGNISLELASRGVRSVLSVEVHGKCCAYINTQKSKYHLEQMKIVKADVLKFITTCRQSFDFIFADPPYDLPQLPLLPKLLFDHNLVRQNGLFVLEHPTTRKVSQHPNFVEQRSYGYSSFSFFECS